MDHASCRRPVTKRRFTNFWFAITKGFTLNIHPRIYWKAQPEGYDKDREAMFCLVISVYIKCVISHFFYFFFSDLKSLKLANAKVMCVWNMTSAIEFPGSTGSLPPPLMSMPLIGSPSTWHDIGLMELSKASRYPTESKCESVPWRCWKVHATHAGVGPRCQVLML